MQQRTSSEVAEQPQTSRQGLTSAEAELRLAAIGPNEPTPVQRGALLRQFLVFLTNPLVLILLLASVVAGLLGEVVNAVIIAVMVLLSIALNFIQTARSQQAADRLRAQVAPTATVRRDGTWHELPRREIVPGDLIRLSAGDLVPADAQLVEAHDLHVQQAALTGESLPVEKEASEPAEVAPSPDEAQNRVFLGTSVVSGTATARVTAAGRQTAFGDIAARLAARAPETEFERGTRRFGLLIMRTVLFLVLFVFLVNVIAHRDLFEPLLFAIALAVGLTPEFLLMITSVTLGQGALHMARRKVIVKHLAAIQNFGSIDVLCSDKTGTLTSGDMVLSQTFDPLGQPSECVFLLTYLNSFHETGIKSPLDVAILKHGTPEVQSYRKLDEIPFDFERRRLSVVVEHEGKRLLITKGAPESVLACCTSYEVNSELRPSDEQTRVQCTATYQQLSSQGYRLLAVAYRLLPEQRAYRLQDERELVLVGYAAFFDPPLDDAALVLEALRRDDIAVKILTGDNELVTRHVCEQVGLDPGRIVLGTELDRMTDAALAHIAEQTTIFARVSPAQKNRIILALKSRSHVVGFLGDGINDAPSLHAADVGISVSTAIDVAKDAAEIILLERSMQVLHQGILEVGDAFDGEGARQGRVVGDLRLLAQAALAQVRFEQERELQRRGWAFIGKAADGNGDVPALELLQRQAQALRALLGVELLRAALRQRFRQTRNFLRREARPAGNDQVVVVQALVWPNASGSASKSERFAVSTRSTRLMYRSMRWRSSERSERSRCSGS